MGEAVGTRVRSLCPFGHASESVCLCVSVAVCVCASVCGEWSGEDRVLLGCCVVGDKAVVLGLAVCDPLVEAGAGRENAIDADECISLTDEFHPAQEGGRGGNRFCDRNFDGEISVLTPQYRWHEKIEPELSSRE